MKGVICMNGSNAEFQRMMEKYKREMEQYIKARPAAATQTVAAPVQTPPAAEEPESAPVPRPDMEQAPSRQTEPMTARAQRTEPEAGYVPPVNQPEGSEELAQQDSQPIAEASAEEPSLADANGESEYGDVPVPDEQQPSAPESKQLHTVYTTDELRNQMPPIMRPDAEANPQPSAPGETPLERPQPIPQYIPTETPDGTMQVRTLSARGAIPVPDVVITVTDPSGRLMFTGTTDNSGATQIFKLPTVARSLSEEPGSLRPFSTYNVKAVLDGFFPATSMNVAVFEGVTALVPFDMIPLPNGTSGRMLEFQNTEPNL